MTYSSILFLIGLKNLLIHWQKGIFWDSGILSSKVIVILLKLQIYSSSLGNKEFLALYISLFILSSFKCIFISSNLVLWNVSGLRGFIAIILYALVLICSSFEHSSIFWL